MQGKLKEGTAGGWLSLEGLWVSLSWRGFPVGLAKDL